MVKCARCGMIYANPVDECFASSSFYDESATEYYLSQDKLEADFSPVRYVREVRFFREFCGSGRVLDVGCSTGGFPYSLSQKHPGCYQCYGTDASSGALRVAAEHGIKTLAADFRSADLLEKDFDAITFWAVLEHLVAPANFLERAFELLKPGGVCFVLVPNYRSLAVRIVGKRYRYILPQHLNYFSAGSLTQLVSVRFRVAKLTTCHFNPLVIAQDLFHGGDFVADADRARLLQKTNRWKQQSKAGMLMKGYQVCEAALARLHLADNLICALIKP